MEPTPPAAAVVQTVQVATNQEDGQEGADFGEAAVEGTRIIVQAVTAVVAGLLGLATLITEVVGSRKFVDCDSFDYGYRNYYYYDYECDREQHYTFIGPGVGCGVVTMCFAMWATILGYHAHSTKKAVGFRSAPIGRRLLCNAIVFTTLMIKISIAILGLSILYLILFSNKYQLAIGILLLITATVCFLSGVIGCVATCKAGCGCGGCYSSTRSLYQPLKNGCQLQYVCSSTSTRTTEQETNGQNLSMHVQLLPAAVDP